jgi:hypothetical protein
MAVNLTYQADPAYIALSAADKGFPVIVLVVLDDKGLESHEEFLASFVAALSILEYALVQD